MLYLTLHRAEPRIASLVRGLSLKRTDIIGFACGLIMLGLLAFKLVIQGQKE